MSFTPHEYGLRAIADRNEKHLKWAEEEIMKWMTTVATTLAEVRDKKWWEGKYDSFNEWANQALGLSRVRVIQILGSHDTKLLLLESKDEEVRAAADEMSENALRAAAKIPDKKKRERTVKTARRKKMLTAKGIDKLANPEKSEKCVCPTCKGSGEIDFDPIDEIPE